MAVAPSVRISEPLKLEAANYASSIGISLSALVAVALRDYLDSRQRGGELVELPAPPRVPPANSKTADVATAPVPAAPALGGRLVPKVGRNQACPCGSRKPYKHCHGKS